MYKSSRTYAFKKSLRRYFRRFGVLVALKKYTSRAIDPDRGSSTLNIIGSFPLFVPNSSGSYKDRSGLTVQTINQTIPFMAKLAWSLGSDKLEILPIRNFPKSQVELAAVHTLKRHLDERQSDKANLHDYHYLYGSILHNTGEIRGVFEIGLGTDNTDVVSTMGSQGKPGASLRAFRDFLPGAKIYGADIDTRILFREDRIQTFFIDQTKPQTFAGLDESLPSDLDLVIDDGLHSPDANILSLNFALSKIRIGGWVVIEDIGEAALPVWHVVSALMPGKYRRYILRAEGGILFAVNRLA